MLNSKAIVSQTLLQTCISLDPSVVVIDLCITLSYFEECTSTFNTLCWASNIVLADEEAHEVSMHHLSALAQSGQRVD